METAEKTRLSPDWLLARVQKMIEDDGEIDPAENLVLYGLDSIAVIAASSKVDIAFIMTLQTARLILVTLIGPWLARFMADRA